MTPPRTLVVNFNSPELNNLALALAHEGALTRYVRPYVNKGRAWERALANLPKLGPVYAATFGRRAIGDARLAALTREAGVAADVGAALIGRWKSLPHASRARMGNALAERVRHAVTRAALRSSFDAECAVAYTGFGLPTFEAVQARGGTAVVNYPIAHHREHRAVQREEHEHEPELAATWPTLEHWPAHYERQIDRELAIADCILVGSSYARDSFERSGVDPRKIAVASYGVDLARFSPGTPRAADPRRPFEAIFAGQLSQRKGIGYLLRAYRRFRKPDTRLTLVGDSPGGMEPLRRYADLFNHIPHRTRPQLAELYRNADVFVFPTLLEGMGLVVLEAMACGLPVIVTANGPGDVVRDGVDGFVVPARDEDAICERLELLYRDRELRAAMGRNASERARQFDWTAYAARVLNVLGELARPSAAHAVNSSSRAPAACAPSPSAS